MGKQKNANNKKVKHQGEYCPKEIGCCWNFLKGKKKVKESAKD